MRFTADFETTTVSTDCRVWAYGLCEIGNTDNFLCGNNIDGLINWCEDKPKLTLYFHNLKFDGEFLIYWLYRHGYRYERDRRFLYRKSFTTLISDKGQFYSLEIYHDTPKKTITTIYDSLKIIPFSVAEVAKAFNLPDEKLELDYNAPREEGHVLTPHEIKYVRADVTIMAKALNVLFEQGLDKMTQGSNALSDFKKTIGSKNFTRWFPMPDYDADIRQSYKGGFTYLKAGYESKDISEGIVLDVNSLYPSVMYYEKMPFGEGIFFTGKYEYDKIFDLYVQMFTCNFSIKPNHIPTIQLKNNLSFVPTEYITDSNGEDITLCLTCVDLKLFFDHYDVYNITYHSGWKFMSATGMFKDYIDKWNRVKSESTLNGNKGMRTLAKLMLNSLYGKFALNPHVQSKLPVYQDDTVSYVLDEPEERNPVYIPVGAFITAYARYKTISSAQMVYDRFIYADTDSLHLIGKELPKGLEIDSVKLGAWKHESTFTRARFLRAKSYIEEIDGKLHITCAGLPDKCHRFVTWENFYSGTRYSGKLAMKRVKGGIVLMNTDFTLKKI